MQIHLDKVTIHNFLSIGDAEVMLANQGYVLVKGHNHNPADGATSNGSGKSSLWNAICWALTGETVQGLKSNIPNIHGADGCFVCLEFQVDGTPYKVIRYREYAKIKNDLKIEIAGEDKSGKGLRDSEELLAQYLPELTSELIGNVIILGQGLPHKFSNNTPSGRKELLENLSHSDFMIQDIKDRIAVRAAELADKLRREEDQQLQLSTSVQLKRDQYATLQKQLEALETSERLQELVGEWTAKENSLAAEVVEASTQVEQLSQTYEQANQNHQKLSLQLGEERSALEAVHSQHINECNVHLAELKAEIRSLQAEIARLEAITDVCPTCGQKLPEVHKPDTTSQHAQLESLLETQKEVEDQAAQLVRQHESELAQLQQQYATQLQASQWEVQSQNTQLIETRGHLGQVQKDLNTAQQNRMAFALRLESLEKTRHELEQSIGALDSDIQGIETQIMYSKEGIQTTQDHIDVINKINSLVKRDFRGVLLTNVINFLDAKIKLYGQYVFNTQDLRLFLEGNNVNIEYCHKAYENLSGGEKQKLDLVIQLAIRDMMCKYLNFSANILVVDECFDGLDASGCDKILDLISNCVTDVESLFIISHHSESLQIPADNILVIEKDEQGISRVVR